MSAVIESTRLSRSWKLFLLVSVIAGFFLRILFVQDMEYKEDEEYNFTVTQRGDWPWIGMPSGVYIPNPGMSVWAFTTLARLTHATEATQLARSLQLFALLGICLLLPFALKILKPQDDRRPWLWAMALALVNPFAVLYQRKLWPEPFLPFFSMMMLAGWWRRETWLGAFIWGLIGACLGQIHMSGFFFAAGFFICTLIFRSQETERSQVKWVSWLIGSVLGAMPLIPWMMHILAHPVQESVTKSWIDALQAKFWVFWVTNPIGLHLGNPLGLLRGQSNWAQISDFVRYPLISNGGSDHATYLNGLAHLVALGAATFILARGIRATLLKKTAKNLHLTNRELAIRAGLWGFGILLTASLVNIRRYYLMVSFPLEFVWLTSLAFAGSATTTRIARSVTLALGALWGAQLVMSACFVSYVHVHEGATQGDYGDAYHVVMRKRAEAAPKNGP